MPSYAILASEPEWGAQYIPPVMMSELIQPLRVRFGLDPAAVGSAGDNNHLYGRHRSRDWCLHSRYCTDPFYATQDGRDQVGAGGWYRAVDVGITGPELYGASRRLDALARSGRCPGLAEWFGTFDGRVVSGWFEGSPSTSDSSHLSHLHIGVWTQFANDRDTMQLLYATVADVTPPAPPPDLRPQRSADMFRLIDPEGGQFAIGLDSLSPTGWSYVEIKKPAEALGRMVAAAGIGTANGNPADPAHDGHANGDWRPGTFGPSVAEVRAKLLDDLAKAVVAKLPAGGGGVTAAQVATAIREQLDATRLAPSVLPGI